MNCQTDWVSAPRSDDEYVRQYMLYTVHLLRSRGISEDDKEDVAQEIFFALLKGKVREMFDPDFEVEHNGKKRKARFKSFHTSQVLKRMQSHRERAQIRARRELHLLDAPMTDHTGHGDGGDSSFAEHLGIDTSPEGDPVQMLIDAENERERAEQLRAILAAQQCDGNLRRLFDRMVEQVRERGRIDIAALKEEFRVSLTTMHTRAWTVHDLLEAHVEVGRRAKRPRTVRA